MNKKWRKKCRIIVIIFILIIIVSPLITALLFIKGSAPKWLDSNNDWISFYGSLISSIISSLIGSVVTITGIFLTVRFTRKQAIADRTYAKKQADEERRFQHKPYLHLKTINNYKIDITTKRQYYQFDPDFNTEIPVFLIIKNLGLGPALDAHIFNFRFSNKKLTNLVYGLYEFDIGQIAECLSLIKVKLSAEDYPLSDFTNDKVRQDVDFSFSILFTDINGINYKQDIKMIIVNFFNIDNDSDIIKYTYEYSSSFMESASSPEIINDSLKDYIKKTHANANNSGNS